MEGLDFGRSEKVVEKSNWGQYVITGAHGYSWAPGDNNVFFFFGFYMTNTSLLIRSSRVGPYRNNLLLLDDSL